MAIVNNADGFTDYNSTGTVYYVAAGGSNSNNGTSTATPFATLAHAYSQVTGGTGAKILLKRGDSFVANTLAWTKSGASSTDFLVLGAYGPLTDPRPQVTCTGSYGIQINNTTVRYVAFQSLNFQNGGAPYGLSFLFQGQGTSKVLDYIDVEDCRFENFYRGMRWQTGDPINLVPQSPTPATNCRLVRNTFKRCDIGFYSSMLHTAEVRENTYIECGVNFQEHGCYFDDARYFATQPAIQYRGNIAMGSNRGGGEGHKLRCVSDTGEIKGNFSARYGIGITAGSGGDANGGGTDMNPGYLLRTNVLSNVVTEGGDMRDGSGQNKPMGQGIWLIWLSGAGSTVRYNCITDMAGGYRAGITFTNGPSNAVTIDQNTCYNAGGSGGAALYSLQTGTTLTGIVVTNNRFREEAANALIISEFGTLTPTSRSGNTFASLIGQGSMVQGAGSVGQYGTVVTPAGNGLIGSKPTITTFLASIGILGNYDTLLAMLDNQRRGAWDTRIEGYRICDHWMAWAGYPLLATASTNIPPTADAGDDATVTDSDRDASVTATLDLTGSTDGDGTISTYTVREGTTTLYNGSDATPDIVLGLGTHVLSVTCTDDDGAVSLVADTVTITAKPGVPTGFDDTAGVSSTTLSVTAYTGVTYEWRYGTTTGVYTVNASTALPTLAVTGVGALTNVFWQVRATAGGVAGDWSAERTATTGAADNKAPTASHGSIIGDPIDSKRTGYATAVFVGSASTDPDGTVVAWSWQEGGVEIATGSTATAVLPIGKRSVDLVVTDNGGKQSAPKRQVYNVYPTSATGVGSTPQSGNVILYCQSYVNADAYVFKYGATTSLGTTVRSAVPSVTIPATGVVYWTVEIEAPGGLRGEPTSIQQTESIVVETHPPIANAGADITDTDTDNTGFESVTLDGSGSTDNGNDIVGWYWVHEGEVLSIDSETYALSAPVGVTSYFLTCIDSEGSISATADEVQVSVTPAQVTGLAPIAGDRQVVLSWLGVNGGVEYEVQSSTASNFGANLVTYPVTSARSMTCTGLTNDTVYYFRARATKDDLDAAWSSTVSETPTARVPPSPSNTTFYKRVERFIRSLRSVR